MPASRLWIGFAAFALWSVALFAQPSPSRAPPPVPDVPAKKLPREALQTLGLVAQGGPFPYERDGVRFGNFEGLLPEKPRGYYREYTVRTPGKRDRGARRIVCGGVDARQPDVCYYTRDHYRSFARIQP